MLLGLVGGVAAAGTFTITSLGNAEFATDAFALNSGGDAAVTTYGPGIAAIAQGINDQGLIAGTTFSQSGAQATLWYDGQAWAAGNFSGSSYATDVNNAGQVVGSAGGRAFIAQNGRANVFGEVLGGLSSTANAVNESGAAVGTVQKNWHQSRGYIWYNGQTQWIGTLGGNSSYAIDINNAGQTAGHAQTATGWLHAFVYQDGHMLDLGTLGGSMSYAYGINNGGDVVGYSWRADGTLGAFLWMNGVMIDLAGLIEGADGWQITEAYAINDAGQIAGTGYFNGVRTAFRLEPIAQAAAAPNLFSTAALSDPQALEASAVPEPSYALLILFGLVGVFVTRRLRNSGKSR